MSEKSGMDMIKELLVQVAVMNKRFEVIEQNTKQILNKLNLDKKQAKPQIQMQVQGAEAPKASVKKSGGGTVTIDVSSLKEEKEAKEKKSPKISNNTPKPVVKKQTTTRIECRLKKDNKAVIGATVGIKDTDGNIIKKTRTNNAGDWFCFLPPGKYVAEYSLSGEENPKIPFSVEKGQKMMQLPQCKNNGE